MGMNEALIINAFLLIIFLYKAAMAEEKSSKAFVGGSFLYLDETGGYQESYKEQK